MDSNKIVSISPGEFVINLLSAFDTNDIKYVYLRNYERIPEDVGHDVDILVQTGSRGVALGHLKDLVRKLNWTYLGCVEFSPLAAFVACPHSGGILHFDFFDRIERHWCEFADAEMIIERRIHNGMVWCPRVGDEVFLNICTRLIYMGIVRDKHRLQLEEAEKKVGSNEIRKSFIAHIGEVNGDKLWHLLNERDWKELSKLTKRFRVWSWKRYGLRKPGSTMRGLVRYIRRSCVRLMRPYAPFIVFLGADGVGKTTVITGLVSYLEEITGISESLLFHWKPSNKSIRKNSDTPGIACDPRANKSRGYLCSFLYLGYHWLGFWWGWLRWILPRLSRNRAVVGDRYAHDIFLDPRRFRIKLPSWILRSAARTVPQPGLIIALTAPPEVIRSRKIELDYDEIEDYQNRVEQLSDQYENLIVVNADNSAEHVVQKVKTITLNWYKKSI